MAGFFTPSSISVAVPDAVLDDREAGVSGIPFLECDDLPSASIDNVVARDIAEAVAVCIRMVVGAVEATEGMIALVIAVMNCTAEMGPASCFCRG